MNKKIFTLLAATTLATAVNAQSTYYGNDGKANWKCGTLTNQPVDPRFGHTPFSGTIATTQQTPITKLENVGGVESTLFQLINDAGYALAMQWDATAQMYQLVAVHTNTSGCNSFVDETLWEVKSIYVGDSKDLRYILVNKASQLPLQVNPSTTSTDAAGNPRPTYVQGSVITWSWSPVANNGDQPLSGVLSAAYNAQYSYYLDAIASAASDGIVTVKRCENDEDLSSAMKFSAYKATTVPLTAGHINAMMTGEASQAPVRFSIS